MPNLFLPVIRFRRKYGHLALYDLLDDLNSPMTHREIARKWNMSESYLSQFVRIAFTKRWGVRHEIAEYLEAVQHTENSRLHLYRLSPKNGEDPG